MMWRSKGSSVNRGGSIMPSSCSRRELVVSLEGASFWTFAVVVSILNIYFDFLMNSIPTGIRLLPTSGERGLKRFVSGNVHFMRLSGALHLVVESLAWEGSMSHESLPSDRFGISWVIRSVRTIPRLGFILNTILQHKYSIATRTYSP